jgi:hypothetical protein
MGVAGRGVAVLVEPSISIQSHIKLNFNECSRRGD